MKVVEAEVVKSVAWDDRTPNIEEEIEGLREDIGYGSWVTDDSSPNRVSIFRAAEADDTIRWVDTPSAVGSLQVVIDDVVC
jgi:hypothetical protein